MNIDQLIKKHNISIVRDKKAMLAKYMEEDNEDIFHTKREVLDLFVGNQYRFETEGFSVYDNVVDAATDFFEFIIEFYNQRKERDNLFIQNVMIDIQTFMWVFGQDEAIKKIGEKLTVEALEKTYKYYELDKYMGGKDA